MVLPDSGDQTVAGELFYVRDIYGSLRELDSVEGFYGYEKTDSLYTRVLKDITTATGNQVLAWTYIYQGKEEGMLETYINMNL